MSHDIEHIMEETLAVTESDSSSVVVNGGRGGVADMNALEGARRLLNIFLAHVSF